MRTSPITTLGFFHKLEEFGESRPRDFWRFEGSLWFHTFAWSVISFFIPILLLNNGFSISEVILFYVIYHGVNVPMNNVARWLTKHHGPKLVMLAATFFAILFFLLYASVGSWQELIVLAILFAIYDALYYVAAIYIFMGQTKDPENSTENTGILYLVIRSASLAGPILGSLLVILSDGNRWVSVGVVITFFIVSLIPLFKLSKIDAVEPEDFVPPKQFFKDPREIKNHISLALYKIHEAVETIILPVYIYLIFRELESVAFLAILIPIASLIFSYTASHMKRGQREKVIIVGSGLLALVWLLRIWIDDPFFMYGSVVATGLFALFIMVPLDANMFKRGSGAWPLSASLYRNSVSMGSKFFLFAFLFFAIEVFHVSFMIAASSLILLGLTNYFYYLWRRQQPDPQTSTVGLPSKKLSS